MIKSRSRGVTLVDFKVGVIYPLWRSFSPEKIDTAMQVVGLDLARWLAARGVDVCLYSEGDRVRWKSDHRDGVVYRRVPRALDAVARRLLRMTTALEMATGRWSPRRPVPLLEKLSYSVLAAWDMRRDGCDVAHIAIFDNLIPIVRRLSPHTKIVFHMHDHKQTHRDAKVVERRLCQADVIVGCSEFITNRVRQRFPQLAGRCHTVLNAVDEALYEPLTNSRDRHTPRKRLLFVGRISPEKGVHTLLEAFRLVLERHPDAELEILGPATIPSLNEVAVMNERSLEELAPFYDNPTQYGAYLRDLLAPAIRERVHFRGAVPHADVHRVFREADVVVFPPIWEEPFGLPVIEAMASGRPVVATRVGAIPEIAEDHKTAILVEPANPTQLAAAVTELLDHPDLIQELGAAGREHVVRRFSWNTRIDEWLAIYDGVSQGNVVRRP